MLARQEYYTANALLNTALLPIAPWKFTSWWSNVLKLGDEMGLGFRRNMLRYDSALMASLMASLSDGLSGGFSDGLSGGLSDDLSDDLLSFPMLPRRAAGIEDLDLDLSSQIDGHRPTALLAVRQLMSVLINLDLSSNNLGPSCMATLSTALHENASLEVRVAAS